MIGLFAIVANLLIVISHIKDPVHCFRVPSSWFILNIALLDIFISIISVIKKTMYITTMYISTVVFTLPVAVSKLWIMLISMSPLLFLGQGSTAE